jgi:hypothetical protein
MIDHLSFSAYRPALPAFGAVEEPEDLPYRYRYRFAVVE